jgi:hypothetical protein
MKQEVRLSRIPQRDPDPSLHPIYIHGWKILGESGDVFGIAVPKHGESSRADTSRAPDKNSPTKPRFSRGRSNRSKKDDKKRPRSQSRDQADSKKRDSSRELRMAPKHHSNRRDSREVKQLFPHDPNRTTAPTLPKMLDWFRQRGSLCIACGNRGHKIDDCKIKHAHFPDFIPPWKQLKELRVYAVNALHVWVTAASHPRKLPRPTDRRTRNSARGTTIWTPKAVIADAPRRVPATIGPTHAAAAATSPAAATPNARDEPIPLAHMETGKLCQCGCTGKA